MKVRQRWKLWLAIVAIAISVVFGIRWAVGQLETGLEVPELSSVDRENMEKRANDVARAFSLQSQPVVTWQAMEGSSVGHLEAKIQIPNTPAPGALLRIQRLLGSGPVSGSGILSGPVSDLFIYAVDSSGDGAVVLISGPARKMS